jgi:hypothetical protein
MDDNSGKRFVIGTSIEEAKSGWRFQSQFKEKLRRNIKRKLTNLKSDISGS